MRYADILSDVEGISQLADQDTLLKRALNAKLLLYAGAYPWPHYRTRGSILTVDDYSTGTAAVTNGSTAVTFTGATLTAGMAGRKIRFESQQAWYDITSVNTGAGTAVLTQAYQGDTDSSVTFRIFQDEYRLAADCYKPLDLLQLQNGVLMRGYSYLDMDFLNPSRDQLGDPVSFALLGRQRDRYTTGTVSISAAGRTLTGSGTAWTSVEGLGRGSRIAVESNSEVYTVDTVDSDTQITTYETAVTAASGAAYRAFLHNLRVQLHDVPNAARHIYYRYLRYPFPLVNDYDEPDLPLEYHYMLVWGGLEIAYAHQGKQAAAEAAAAQYAAWVQLQKDQLGSEQPATTYTKQSMDRALDTLIGPVYGSQYGVPLSLR